METINELLKELISLVREIKDDMQIQHSATVECITTPLSGDDFAEYLKSFKGN